MSDPQQIAAVAPSDAQTVAEIDELFDIQVTTRGWGDEIPEAPFKPTCLPCGTTSFCGCVPCESTCVVAPRRARR